MHSFHGKHILAEMYGCSSRVLDDISALKELLQDGIEATGATTRDLLHEKFEPQGVTLLALLSESHASIHTYPEYGSMFLDIFTCGSTCAPEELINYLEAKLEPLKVTTKIVTRGKSE